jgi:hypothetical protein
MSLYDILNLGKNTFTAIGGKENGKHTGSIPNRRYGKAEIRSDS